MKYFKYSQYLYLIIGIAFLISATIKYSKGKDFGIQLIFGIGLITMSLIRHFMLKRIERNQKK